MKLTLEWSIQRAVQSSYRGLSIIEGSIENFGDFGLKFVGSAQIMVFRNLTIWSLLKTFQWIKFRQLTDCYIWFKQVLKLNDLVFLSTDTKINRNDVKNEKETEKWNWTFFLLKVKGHSNLNVKSFQLFNGCRANISKIGPAISPFTQHGKAR